MTVYEDAGAAEAIVPGPGSSSVAASSVNVKMESITVEPDDLGLFDHVLNAVLRDSEAS